MLLKSIALSLYRALQTRIHLPLSFGGSCKHSFASGKAVKQIALEEHPGVWYVLGYIRYIQIAEILLETVKPYEDLLNGGKLTSQI